MKSIYIIILIMLSTALSAQKWEVGMHGGVTTPSLSDNSENLYSKDFRSTTGFLVGLVTECRLGKWYSIAGEINYIKNGGKRVGMQPIPPSYLSNLATQNPALGQLVSSGIPYATFVNRNDLRYIDIPIIFRINTTGKDFRLFLGAGMSASFLLSANNYTSGSSYLYLSQNGQLIPLQTYVPNEIDFTNKTDIIDNLRKVSANIIGSIGFAVNTENFGEFIVEVRPSYGLTPLQKDANFGSSRVGFVGGLVGFSIFL